MTAERTPKRVAIVGGGVSGLATAYYLQAAEAPPAVTVLEARDRPGGKVVTARPDGFVVEGGPDAFLATLPWALELIRELGLESQLVPTNPDQRRVYVLSNDRLHPLPEGVRLIAPTQWWPFLRSGLVSPLGKLRMALDLVRPARREADDESIAQFVRRRFGSEALDKLGQPFMAGIYNAYAEDISLGATFPQFGALEREHGSVVRGLWAQARARAQATGDRARTPFGSTFVSLADGTGTLVETLHETLGPDIVRLRCPAERLARTASGWQVTTPDGPLEADALVLATPAPTAAQLLEPVAPQLAEGLADIRHLATATVSLGFRRAQVGRPLDGYGFVVARGQPLRINGCTWSSTKLPDRAPDDHVLLRAFVGGDGAEDDVALDDETLVELVRADLDRVLGLDGAPTLARVFRWPTGSPLYEVGHLARIDALEARCPPGLHLVGASYRGIGVPRCIGAARTLAERLSEPA